MANGKVASFFESLIDPKKKLESQHAAIKQQIADTASRPGDPTKITAAFLAKFNALRTDHESFLVNALMSGDDVIRRPIVTPGSNEVPLDGVLALIAWLIPDAAERMNKVFVEAYPKNWISESDRVKELRRLAAELTAIDRQLVALYDELDEAGLDFIPIANIDPAIFLGIEG